MAWQAVGLCTQAWGLSTLPLQTPKHRKVFDPRTPFILSQHFMQQAFGKKSLLGHACMKIAVVRARQ